MTDLYFIVEIEGTDVSNVYSNIDDAMSGYKIALKNMETDDVLDFRLVLRSLYL